LPSILIALQFSTWTGTVWPNLTYPDFEVIEDCGDPLGVLSPNGTGCLFDLSLDPTEHVNIAAEQPDVVDRLRALVTQAQKTVFAPLRGEADVSGVCRQSVDGYHGFLGPFVGLPA
jgi:hypothetical protein